MRISGKFIHEGKWIAKMQNHINRFVRRLLRSWNGIRIKLDVMQVVNSTDCYFYASLETVSILKGDYNAFLLHSVQTGKTKG